MSTELLHFGNCRRIPDLDLPTSPRLTIVDLLMQRDGLSDTEAQEISDDIQAQVIQGSDLAQVLARHNIHPRELGLNL